MFIVRPEKCLYHLNHNLVLFCKCSSCYLPICQVCIRIHKNQHIMYKTQPDFQNIDTVIKSVHNQFLEQQRKTSFIDQKISQIPPKLSLDQTQFKTHFLQQRQKIILKFEQLLLQLEKSFIRQIHKQEIHFLADLQNLERESEVMKTEVKQNLQSLEHYRSQTRMQTIIQFYSEDKKAQFDSHFDRFLSEIQKCNKKHLQVPQLTFLKQIDAFLQQKLKLLEEPSKSNLKTQKGPTEQKD